MPKGLKQLSKILPDHPEVNRIMDGLRSEKDISVAIVATTIIDAYLERALTAKFKYSSKKLLRDLFETRSPLSSFSAKIDVAQAFGVITSPLAAEMHTVREIRNVFAHAKIQISFDEPAIADKTNSMKMLQQMKQLPNPVTGEHFEFGSNKSAFLLTTKIILISRP